MKQGKSNELPDVGSSLSHRKNMSVKFRTSLIPYISNSKLCLQTHDPRYENLSCNTIISLNKKRNNLNHSKPNIMNSTFKDSISNLPSIRAKARFNTIKPVRRKRLPKLYCISITQPSIPSKPIDIQKFTNKPAINLNNLLVPGNNATEDNSTDLCENDQDSIEEPDSPSLYVDVSFRASARFNSPALSVQADESENESINTEITYLLQSSKLTSKSITHMTVEELESELQITSNVIRYHEVKIQLLTTDPIFKGIQGKIKRWRAGELLGQGSMGQVIKAFDVNIGSIIAVKRLFFNPNNFKQKDLIEALKQEANILKHFRHTNIVSYLGSEILDENLYMYLEYVPGGSLAHILSTVGPLPENTIKLYMKQILKGIEYLHKNRVVHRDIKAANLLVDIDGTIKLSDFGCARRYESDMQSGLLNSIKGSLLWMAPEVIKQSGYGRRADIWSLGCTFIELLTGKPPWSNFDNSISAMLRIGLSSDLPEIPPTITAEARDFILACLQRDAHLRPTAAHLLHHPFVNY